MRIILYLPGFSLSRSCGQQGVVRRRLPTNVAYAFMFIDRIPFFFEPNFEAYIKPLVAASRIHEKDSDEKPAFGVTRRPMVYGEFLMKKVGSNFASGKGRYKD